MKYVVVKDFLDRFDSHRHCKPGEPHIPPTKKRAELLISQGYIAVVEEQKSDDSLSSKEPQHSKKTTIKKKESKAKPEGDYGGETPTDK